MKSDFLTPGAAAVLQENRVRFQERVGKFATWVETSGAVPAATVLSVDLTNSADPKAVVKYQNGTQDVISITNVCCVDEDTDCCYGDDPWENEDDEDEC